MQTGVFFFFFWRISQEQVGSTYLVGVRASDKQHWAGLRDLPRSSRDDLSKEEVDEIAHGMEERVILPVDHGIELLLLALVLRWSGITPRCWSFLRVARSHCDDSCLLCDVGVMRAETEAACIKRGEK